MQNIVDLFGKVDTYAIQANIPCCRVFALAGVKTTPTLLWQFKNNLVSRNTILTNIKTVLKTIDAGTKYISLNDYQTLDYSTIFRRLRPRLVEPTWTKNSSN